MKNQENKNSLKCKDCINIVYISNIKNREIGYCNNYNSENFGCVFIDERGSCEDFENKSSS